jgi:hypothetical protein
LDERLSDVILDTVEKDNPQTVDQLAIFVAKKTYYSRKEILAGITALQGEGKLSFSEPVQNASVDVRPYFLTSRANSYWLTVGLAILTTVCVFLIPADAFPFAYIRIGFGLVFILSLPGYSLVRALFPGALPVKTSSETLDDLERLALSVGASLALVPLVGLALNYTPWGITLTSSVLALFVLTLLLSSIAVTREYRAAVGVQRPEELP